MNNFQLYYLLGMKKQFKGFGNVYLPHKRTIIAKCGHEISEEGAVSKSFITVSGAKGVIYVCNICSIQIGLEKL